MDNNKPTRDNEKLSERSPKHTLKKKKQNEKKIIIIKIYALRII